MSKQLSLYALMGLVALIGVLFYQVIQPFIVAIFIASVLAVLFEPVHGRTTRLIGGRKRIAAGLTTAGVVFLLILPIGGILLLAGGQLASAAKQAVEWFEATDGNRIEKTLEQFDESVIGARLANAYKRLSTAQQMQIRQATSNLSEGVANELVQKTRGMVGDLFESIVGFLLMTLGLYYFLADGRTFLAELHRLLPFEEIEEQKLWFQFQSVCRGVVLGTVVAGLAQAALAGIAFSIIGVAQVWLLIVLTMVCSFIPFVGAVAVWVPVALYLFFDERYTAAIGLAVFGTLVISTADNLIRAHVIGSEAKLHPLVALVTVLGALKLVGLWGIFIGPMVAAFFYALAQILRDRILASRL